MSSSTTSSPTQTEGLPSGPQGDGEDVRLATAGDKRAFDRLVLRYQDDVVNAAYYFLGSYEDAVDASQEAFLKAYRSLKGFRGSASFRTWVLRIVLNTARSLRARARAKKRAGRVLSLDSPGPTGSAGVEAASSLEVPDPRPGSAPCSLLERKELKEALERAIVELDVESREVIVLRDISGESYEHIAASLALPLGTVKSRVHRARLELQRKLSRLL